MAQFIWIYLHIVNHHVLEIIPKQVLQYLDHITSFLSQ